MREAFESAGVMTNASPALHEPSRCVHSGVVTVARRFFTVANRLDTWVTVLVVHTYATHLRHIDRAVIADIRNGFSAPIHNEQPRCPHPKNGHNANEFSTNFHNAVHRVFILESPYKNSTFVCSGKTNRIIRKNPEHGHDQPFHFPNTVIRGATLEHVSLARFAQALSRTQLPYHFDQISSNFGT